MIRSIVTVPNPILNRPCAPITKWTEDEDQLLTDLFDTVHAAHGMGLAAPQIGVPLRLAVISIPKNELFEGEYSEDPLELVLINPTIEEQSGTDIADEGCLSIPGVRYLIERPLKITIRVTDYPSFKALRESGMTLSHLLARAACHEIDHLNGILITDRVKAQSVPEGAPSQPSA